MLVVVQTIFIYYYDISTLWRSNFLLTIVNRTFLHDLVMILNLKR